jgi:outer membrane lipoprotein SlyB
MKLRSIGTILAAAGVLATAGCATYDGYGYSYDRPYTVYEAPAPIVRGPVVTQRVEYGVVERIDLFRDGASAPVGLGSIIGGIAGGVLGHQIGSGRGNTAATIAGAVGGAVVGNQIERSHARDRYRVWVRMDSGESVAVDNVGEGELRVGDRVRIVNGRVFRG